MASYPLTPTSSAPTSAHALQGKLVYLLDRQWVVRVGYHHTSTWTCWLVAATNLDLIPTHRQLVADTELADARTQLTDDDLADAELFLLLWTVRLTQARIGNSESLGRVLAWQLRQPGQLTIILDQRNRAILATRARVLPIAQPAALARLVDARLLTVTDTSPTGADTYQFTLPDNTFTAVG